MTDVINEEGQTFVPMPQSELDTILFGDHEQLARDFVGLVFPRLINQFSEQTQYEIEAMRQMKSGAKDPAFEKELNAAQVRLKKALSEEVMQKVMDKMVALLKEALEPHELAYAIYQERITIKISGIAAQLETAFVEALGETNP
ncbi:hypothetical protein GAP31_136 [Cronobacter phage vB_CsaM_GAP31]|uniref:Uncharacterized protein n=1 Tax=Cronobacter phage vB_CsaM_GAP31 TaxID=1141135 RepID=K4F609_9CAUD|nr:hypothetical protein GAP31_136 [Cronobacter phage vB_CsaM_GAP31]AFC21318.1 hypothetical protein GAP31_136 [Cronobacter phage vB_CsaM_GAP31]